MLQNKLHIFASQYRTFIGVVGLLINSSDVVVFPTIIIFIFLE